MTPSNLSADINKAINTAKKNFEKITSLNETQLNYENCIRAFDRATSDLDTAWNWANHLDAVANSEALRNAISEVLPIVTDFYSSIYLDEKLWGVIKKYSLTPEAETLDGYKKALLKRTIENFLENGADLPEEKKARLKEIQTALAQKTQKFSDNVLDATNAYSKHITDIALLEGLPKSALDLAAKKATQENLEGWVFTLHQPLLTPVLTYAKNESLRKEMWFAASKVGRCEPFDNTLLTTEILSLRKEEAEILGYKNFADFILHRRMAKNSANALDFLRNLKSKIDSYFLDETKSLESFKSKHDSALNIKSSSALLNPWDVAYYAELQRKAEYDFTPEVMRDYFEFEKVTQGLFSIASTLFGLKIQKANKPALWDENVEFYEVRNERGKHIGSFYADFFPRKNKRSGAWMNLLKQSKGIAPALGFIGGNFNEASAGKPALLSHEEVSTLFHEFGHLIHFFLMDCTEIGLRDVAWDFVELPSQIMENWCGKRECLNIFAEHYLDKTLIPDNIYSAFDKSRKFRAASDCMRQLLLSVSDMLLHTQTEIFLDNLDEVLDNMTKEYKMPLAEKSPNILPRFTHIFGDSVGYAAGYYSYKWAEVLDADAFTKFEKFGILSPKIGKEFANKILRVGSTIPPEEAFENFMGRKPSLDALIKRILPDTNKVF